VVLIGKNGEMLAHGAITFVFEDQKMLEIGAIIVDKNFRGKGLGKIVTSEVVALANSNFPDYVKIALCNENSLPMFLKMGAVEVNYSDLGVDPGVFLSECVNCPRYANAIAHQKQCCDTLVVV
jgi:predicted GNAT family N-acyltransferase